MAQERFALVNGVELNYFEGPDNGPPLLLLPGFPDAWREWLPVIPPLSVRWHLYALSIRGMDRSGRAEHYTLEDLVEDVIVFARDVIGEPTFVVGHSGGAVMGACAAGREPGLFRGLVVGDVPLDAAFHINYGAQMTDHFTRVSDLIRRDENVPSKLVDFRAWPVPTGGTVGDHMSTVEMLRMIGDLHGVDPNLFGPWTEGRLDEFEAVFDSAPGDYRGPIMFISCDPEAGGLLGPKQLEAELGRYPWAHHATLPGKSHGMGLYEWEIGPLMQAVSSFLEAYR